MEFNHRVFRVLGLLVALLAAAPAAWAQGAEPVTASSFVLAFVGGLALNLTPCVYPLIPITLSFFAGQAPPPKILVGGQAQQRWGRTAVLATCYVLGLAITYSTLGLTASLTGGMLGAALQQPWVLILTALVMVGLGLSLCGLFEFRVPAVLTSRLGVAKTGAVGALIMGLTVGIVAAPCIGPFVLGMLLYVGQLGQPVVGFWLFFALALGLGLPYLFLGVFAGQLHRLPRSGAWLTWVKRLLGCAMFGVALYLVLPLLPTASTSPSPITWAPYTDSILKETGGKPVLVDVYADWCIPCHEMDATTYRDPHVVEHTQVFTMVKLDATNLNPTEEAFIERYEVFGVPTLLAFDAQGRERQDLRRTGYVSAQELLDILRALQGH